MNRGVYERISEALDQLPNGFPKTESGVEIEIVKVMFTPQEAEVPSALSDSPKTPEQIAERVAYALDALGPMLDAMADKGQVARVSRDGEGLFCLSPFVSAYDSAMSRLEGAAAHRLAHLMEEYIASTGGLVGIMTPEPALHRVVPARNVPKSEWILPYDDVRAFLANAKSFALRDCVCRKQQDLLGDRKCKFPRRTCMHFSPFERPVGPDTISREQALAFLDEAEEMGLVHTVSNVAKGINYVCNCCGCCCVVLRGIAEFGLTESVAHANYFCDPDPATCAGCGTCVQRCQVGAISLADSVATVDKERCIGCGLCVTTCTTGAAQLRLKPKDKIVDPPDDVGAWSRARKTRRSAGSPQNIL